MHKIDSPVEWLETVYKELEFDQGLLQPAIPNPQPELQNDWLDTGDWQSLADQVGAEKIFFVGRDPVVVFAKAESDSQEVLKKIYKQIWCMSRPQLLFLASPGQLTLLDLTKSPPGPSEQLDDKDRLIERITSLAEVQSKLGAYHRECIETGAVFGEKRFRNSANRADRALIRDLKTVRYQLEEVSLPLGTPRPELRHLHSLIGRAIFVRYLEDREILTPAYFEEVAACSQAWMKILGRAPSIPSLEPRMLEVRFLRILQNKEFTYALFHQLADDFNGDTFPIRKEEEESIQQEHLDKLLGFLIGNTSPQEELFFFAYQFEVIPIELISAIYEEFYNEQTGKERNQGSHFTPPALVEFVLSNTLTPEVLDTSPRVFDPACGSGIFLVESFRRMVRHLWSKQNGRPVDRTQLCNILREQIAGIDINEEAVRVAAFSLYLAFLHYQEPRDINEKRRLPYLKWVAEKERQCREKQKPGSEFFDILLQANAFEAIAGKFPIEVTKRFGSGCATVVVGNPPWGSPKKDDEEGQKALAETIKWCDDNGRPVGDTELSQAFIHLILELLKDGGSAGLLVSTGIFFKIQEKNREFRRVWLNSVRLKHIVNFAHVRQVFFSGSGRKSDSMAPFSSVVFEKTSGELQPDDYFQYWSAKRTATIENTQCVVLNRGDMHWLSQRDCLADEKLWKIYWWGGHRDEQLIRSLNCHPSLIDLSKQQKDVSVTSGVGFVIKKIGKRPADWLANFKELPVKKLTKYGRVSPLDLIKVPNKVARKGDPEVFEGSRLLIRRGVPKGGELTVRLETNPFCFRHSIIGIRLKGFEPWQEKIIIAIYWSSLVRYYLFCTAGSWGMWHDELLKEIVVKMPICFPEDPKLRDRIVRIVDELLTLDLGSHNFQLSGEDSNHWLSSLEHELDDAIFDLYELNIAKRGLVREMCTIGLDFLYRHKKSDAVREVVHPSQSIGLLVDVDRAEDGLAAYLRTFLEIWNEELEPDGEFQWQILSPPSRAPLLAVSFITRYKEDLPSKSENYEHETWQKLLARLEENSLFPSGISRIFIDTFFRLVTSREIIFIKRNEQRFWTCTAAREDAESALAHLMNWEDSTLGNGR